MPTLTNNAIEVLNARYLLKDVNGNIFETPEALFRRVAKQVASAESSNDNGSEVAYWEEQFYELLSGLYFLPNSPALMNSGTSSNQLSACFVLPIENGIDNIFKTLKETVIIQLSNGGTGFNFSKLQSENGHTQKEKQFSLGPIETIEIFDAVVEKMKQHSKRAGANIGILNDDHPDIIEFIKSKKEEGKIQNFNISVGVTDKFMKAVENNSNWELKDIATNNITKTIKAIDLWNELIENSWKSGDPGIIFLDAIERNNPVPSSGKLISTNPCGEVPLLAHEACNLGSINLSKFVKNNNKGELEIAWLEIESVVKKAVRFLDNIITVGDYLLPEIQKTVYSNRKIGLGVMGWADMLLLLEIPYQSEKAIALGETLMEFINKNAHEASQLLAKEKGTFPNWEKSIFHEKYPIRNATCTSIAPTGTIAIIAGTSPSIEPLFALAFSREGILGNKTLIEINPILLNKLEKYKLNSTTIVNEIKETGILPSHKTIPSHLKELFLTAHEIDLLTHIRHQSAFQKHTDNAVSKTINLPENATKEDISNAYKYAWKHQLKGITVFRQGCRIKQIMRTGIQMEDATLCGKSTCVD